MTGQAETVFGLTRQSLSLKIVLAGLVAIACFVAIMLALNYVFVTRHLEQIQLDRAKTIAHSLDAGIRSLDDLENRSGLYHGLQKSIWLEPDLLSITIYRPRDDGLVGFVSSRPDNLDKPASDENHDAYTGDRVVVQRLNTLEGEILRVYAPIRIARRQVGTYQFDLTLEGQEKLQRDMLNSMLKVYFPLIVLTVFLLIYYIRRHVVIPVGKISRGARQIAGGSLDTRIEIASGDELGGLGDDFNQMAASLEKQRRDIVDAQKKLEHLALHDLLTGLPNREYLQQQIPHDIASCKRHGRHGALLLMDLDQFKSVNDSLGHDAGDQLLGLIGQRLRRVVRQEDFVARLGGDEFVVVLSEISVDAEDALAQVNRVVNSILDEISQPLRLESSEILVTASIGIVFFPVADDQFEKLMKNADSAMYKAKEEGGNRARYFNQIMQHLLETRSRVLRTLREAIHSDQMTVYYQPQVDADGRLIGAEALVRWVHPQYGLTMPQDFIGIIENHHLIIDLSQWVLETVCRQFASIYAVCGDDVDFNVSVNISSNQFHQVNFVEQIFETLDRYDFPAARLVLEITESVLLRNLKDVREKIERIKQRGIRVSLDDYGTGYSSLAYLKNLELDEIKMDGSFVRDLFASDRDQELVCSIIGMTNSLNMSLVAEGVETEAQFDFLRSRSCQGFQGYYFEEPLPLSEFENYVARRLPELSTGKGLPQPLP